MSRRFLTVSVLVVLALALGGVLGAQGVPQQPAPPPNGSVSTAPDQAPASYDTPPAITLVDGSARLLRQGLAQQAVTNMPLLEGDRILTDTGRVAVTFPDGTLLHIDRGSSVDFLSVSLFRVNDGRVILAVAGQGGERPAADYRVDTPGGSVQIQAAGEYRISTFSGDAVPAVDLAVMSGVATLMNDRGNVEVDAGQRSWARAGASPEFARAFNSANLDEFDRWSDSQRNAYAASNANAVSVSSEYLPENLDSYSSTFDQYGTWENTADYGYVWYPRVASTWRPYYNGYWDYVGPYGWTWIGYDAWCWPTHHFGRWGFNAGLWFWIPTAYWGPAWVSWGYSGGYLSWCPLNYWNHACFNIHNGYWDHGHHYEPWHGWTVAPRHSFGAGERVASYAVNGNRIPVGDRTGFAVQRGAPAAPRGYARTAPGASTFSSVRAMPRALGPTRYSSNSPSYASAARRSGAPSASAGSRASQAPFARPGNGAMPRGYDASRGSARPGTTFENRAPGAMTTPRAYDRPSSTAPGYAQPRGYRSYPGSTAPSRGYDRPSTNAPGYAQPRTSERPSPTPPAYAQPRGYERPAPGAPGGRPRSDVYARPAPYSAPRAAPYGAPRSSMPPGYGAPRSMPYSAPRSAPPAYGSPRSMPPAYSAPRAMPPGYSAPRSMPSYSGPRSMPSYSAPRSAPSAPRGSAPSAAPRSAPSHGGGQGGHRGR